MILEIDAGNSRIKWRVLVDGGVRERGFVTHDEATWITMSAQCFDVSRIRVANVAGSAIGRKLELWAQTRFGVTAEFAVSKNNAAGVTSGYDAPDTLGVDRWLAIIAAWDIVRGPCLVVDAGTTLTADLVSATGQHLGGYIVPGFSMMFQALFQGTSGVRFEQRKDYSCLPGKNTRDAVQNGCFLMSLALIEKALAELQQGTGVLAAIVFTGGGSEPLAAFFEERAQSIQDLVLDGLALAIP